MLNVLRWRTPAGDARLTLPPEDFQLADPFGGDHPPVVTRAEFAETGFTGAHLTGVRFHGWRMPSTLVSTVGQLLADGEPFVYAYYDGVDKVAHEYGLGRHYDAESARPTGWPSARAPAAARRRAGRHLRPRPGRRGRERRAARTPRCSIG